MPFLGPLGHVNVTVPSGQSIIVGAFGIGSAKVLYGSGSPQPIYYPQGVVSGGSTTFGSMSADQLVRIESTAGEVEYVIGAAPQLTRVNAAQMPTFKMGAAQAIKRSAANALTAHVGGGQASALALTSDINRVTTVASAGDSVKLPAAVAGRQVTVMNSAAANAMDCFPQSGEIINALSANTALSIAANKTVIFSCAVDGTWNSVLTA